MDDLPAFCAGMKRLLETYAGFSVRTAATIEEALVELDEWSIDAVVADLHLGGPGAADGGELLDAVASWHRGLVRIIASADPLGATIARESGHLYWDKDRPLLELVAMIRQSVPRA